jgi:hypothetical protein
LNDDVPDFWNKEKVNDDYRLPVKIQFEGLEQPVIFLMKRNMKLSDLSHKIGMLVPLFSACSVLYP